MYVAERREQESVKCAHRIFESLQQKPNPFRVGKICVSRGPCSRAKPSRPIPEGISETYGTRGDFLELVSTVYAKKCNITLSHGEWSSNTMAACGKMNLRNQVFEKIEIYREN